MIQSLDVQYLSVQCRYLVSVCVPAAMGGEVSPDPSSAAWLVVVVPVARLEMSPTIAALEVSGGQWASLLSPLTLCLATLPWLALDTDTSH